MTQILGRPRCGEMNCVRTSLKNYVIRLEESRQRVWGRSERRMMVNDQLDAALNSFLASSLIFVILTGGERREGPAPMMRWV